ncbi:MAG TPA: hypothetical protein VKZ59_15130 [Acidobacteriota bacterium]|nr:hypothetical protein [Acidobacteriota bacterium]
MSIGPTVIKADETKRPIRVSAAESVFLRAVLYSSVFKYPLTLEELRRNLPDLKIEASSLLALYDSSPFLKQVVEFSRGYFYPRGRREWIALRGAREAVTREALEVNQGFLRLIALIPWTRLVAVSGSAAHLNMDRGGDIDLFIITRGSRVWSVACSILLLSKLAGKRKQVCFNFLLSDRRLALEREDIFTLSQMIHLKPLIGASVYRQFLEANPAVRKVYPNAFPTTGEPSYTPGWFAASAKTVLELLLCFGLGQIFEVLCRSLYRRYLLGRSAAWSSPEEVVLAKDFLKLHSHSHRQEVLSRLESLLHEAFLRL